MDPDTLTRPTPDHIPLNGEAIGDTGPPSDWNVPSDQPASVTLGWCVADIYMATFTRLDRALPDELASQMALELTRIALNSRLVETLMVRKG